MPAPTWAENIVRDVARRKRRPGPTLRWRRSRRRRSAGSADSPLGLKNGTISVVAGRDPVDQRLVLCHEIAHWLGKPYEGHSLAFWRRAWRLYRRYRVPIYYALAREGDFHGAIQAYRHDLVARRRASRNVRPQRR
jgi:hypothetical protein